MNQVYRHRPLASDQLLGRVEADGSVYETRFGPDRHIGRVEVTTGKIYETRLGPDKYIGRVELESGKVFYARFGPDEYLGRVDKDGKIYHHQRLAPDQYLGKVVEMSSFAHGGAAFLLLIQPIYAEESNKHQEEKPRSTDKSETGETGGNPAPA